MPQPPLAVDWDLTFSRSPIGMAIVAPDGTITRANAALETMLGHEVGGLVGRSFRNITHADDLAADDHLLAEALAGARDGYRLTKRYLHREGRIICGDLSVVLVRDEAGAPHHFISQVLDITHEREIQVDLARTLMQVDQQREDLARSNADLMHFAGVASHDLRSPLTVVRGYLDLIAGDCADASPEGIANWANAGLKAADQMDALLAALLQYATIDPADRTDLDLDVIAKDALTDVGPLLRDRDLTLAVEIPSYTVRGSAALIRTLVVNLVSNAIKHGPPDPEVGDSVIRVQATRRPGGTVGQGAVQLCVEDNGPGIPPDRRAAVLEIFGRGPSSHAGHGIGLATCQRIMERHGGTLELGRSALGGLAVRCTFPSAKDI